MDAEQKWLHLGYLLCVSIPSFVGITDLCFSQPQELLNVFLISALIKLRISRTVFYLFSCFLISPLLPDMTPCLMPGKMTVSRYHISFPPFHASF